MIRPDELPTILFTIAKDITAGGWAYLVGGTPRDMLLDVKPKDFDFEVFGIAAGRVVADPAHIWRGSREGLEQVPDLRPDWRAWTWNFMPPRRENKIAGDNAHTSFVVFARSAHEHRRGRTSA